MTVSEWDDEIPADPQTGEVPAQLEAPVDETEPQTWFGSVDEFVRDFLSQTYRRPVNPRGEFRWSAQWWKYPEAVARLDALWRAWEALRGDAAMGMTVWWRDHADHHMGVLLSPSGPFAKSTDLTDVGDPLPYAAPPEGMFPDLRDLPS